MPKLLSMVAAVIVWGLLSLTLPPEIFPVRSRPRARCGARSRKGELWTDLAMTMLRVVAGLLLALIMRRSRRRPDGTNRRAEAVLDV